MLVPGIVALTKTWWVSKKWRFSFIGRSEMEGERFLLWSGMKTPHQSHHHPPPPPNHIPPALAPKISRLRCW